MFLRTLTCVCFLGLSSPAMAQGTQVAFGTTPQDTDAPVEVTADELNVDQATGEAIFTGNVLISQDDMRLSAPRVLVIDRDGQKGIERLEATGGVTLISGPDAAEGQRADYDIDSGLVVITGDVLLTQSSSVISGDLMTVDLDDGTAHVQGRVKTILQTTNE